MKSDYVSGSAEETFEIAFKMGQEFKGGEIVLLKGPLGAGKTIFAKGLLAAIGFDPDEVTSPSFALVNRYETGFDVFHIDLWRLEASADAAFAVGLDEILENENAIVIVEWSERLDGFGFGKPVTVVEISGSGDVPRTISIKDRL